MASATHTKERQLQRDVARTVESTLPGVEVLALELTGKERFCVYVDHPQGVDHALCERVTEVLRPYLDEYSVEVSSPGFERPLRTTGAFRARRRHERPREDWRPVARAARFSPPVNGPPGSRTVPNRQTYRTTRSCGPI